MSEITYVTLKGGEPAGKPSEINSRTARPIRRPTTRWRGSRNWQRSSRTKRTPYLSLVHPMWTTHYGDYDHLARVKEWSATGGGEDKS